MRIDELVFQRVGAWRGQVLSLRPGLNLVVGPNEAGKSTALRAIEAMLFDVPARSREDALSELVAPLRVADFEATIHASRTTAEGDERGSWRRRGPSLEWSDGRKLSAVELAAWMWDVSRRDFRLLYALGHERLREGGLLLAAGGPLANVVADITGGVNGIPELRADLTREREALYKQRGATQTLNKAFGVLSTLRRERAERERAESHGKYLDLCRRIDDLDRAARTNREQYDENDQRLQVLSRLRAVSPTIEGVHALEGQLSAHPYAAAQGDERWYARLDAAMEEVGTTRDAVRAAEGQRTRAATFLEGRAPSAPVLQHRSAIERALHVAPTLDEYDARRDRELAVQKRTREELTGVLEACGLPITGDPVEAATALRLPAPALEALVGLQRTLEVAREAAARAARLVDTADAEHREALARLDLLPEPISVDPLEDLRRQGELAEREAELQRGRHAQDLEGTRLRAVAARLGLPSPSDLFACLSCRIPSRSDAQSLYDRARALTERKAGLDAALDAATRRLRDHERRIAALSTASATPVDRDALTAARRSRDEAMDALAQVLQEPQPAPLIVSTALRRVATTVQSVDHVTDRLLDDAKRLADLDAARHEVAQSTRELEDLQRDAAAEREQRAELEIAWRSLWAESRVEITIGDQAWWATYEAFLREAQAWQDTESTLAGADRTFVTRVAEARRALALADEFSSCATLDRRLEDRIKTANERAEERRRAEDAELQARQRLDRARSEGESARSRRDESQAALTAALADAPDLVKRDDRVAEAWIARSLELSSAAGAFLDAARRVHEGAQSHETAVAQVEEAWRLVLASAPDSLPDGELTEPRPRIAALGVALAIAAETARLERELHDAQQAVDDAVRVAAAAVSVLGALIAEAGLEVPASGLADAVEGLRAAHTLRRQIEIDRAMACQGVGLAWPALVAALGDHDRARLDAEIARLREANAALKDQGESIARDQTSLRSEREALERGESVAELSQQWERAVAPMLAALEDTLATQGALFVLDEVESSIREDERLVAIASAASLHFARLTRGSFDRVDFDAQRTSIVVTRSGSAETALEPPALSDGTRDQLWLAFRLALIEQHMAAKRLPLILDDVLVHFDPERATAALEAFAEFAKHTQVLMFTHDPGLVELARRASLDFHLVELPRREIGGDAPSLPALDPGIPTPRGPAQHREARAGSAGVDRPPKHVDDPSPTVASSDLEAFMAALTARPEGRYGNKALRDMLGWTEDRYDAAKSALLAAGAIRIGQGRGGSVRLPDPP